MNFIKKQNKTESQVNCSNPSRVSQLIQFSESFLWSKTENHLGLAATAVQEGVLDIDLEELIGKD